MLPGTTGRIRGASPTGPARIATPTHRASPPDSRKVAPALRDRRGSQPQRARTQRADGTEWRRPYGTGEDRNPLPGAAISNPDTLWRRPYGTGEDRNESGSAHAPLETPWRWPYGTGEDRNCADQTRAGASGWWRRPYGTGEDRNVHRDLVDGADGSVAPALRDRRGSQPA